MAARHSAAVYRRRRLAVLIALLLVIAVLAAGVWMLVARPWEGADVTPGETTTEPSDTTSSTDSPENSASPTDESPAPSDTETPGVVACEAADVEVEAVTDAETYTADQLPQLSISLTNVSAADCTINVGTTTQRFMITSGDDQWWRSWDCQENPSDMIVTLAAGQTVSSGAALAWDRTRSSTTTCADENRQRAPGGGASYHVAVSIGGFDSTGTKQIFLQ